MVYYRTGDEQVKMEPQNKKVKKSRYLPNWRGAKGQSYKNKWGQGALEGGLEVHRKSCFGPHDHVRLVSYMIEVLSRRTYHFDKYYSFAPLLLCLPNQSPSSNANIHLLLVSNTCYICNHPTIFAYLSA